MTRFCIWLSDSVLSRRTSWHDSSDNRGSCFHESVLNRSAGARLLTVFISAGSSAMCPAIAGGQLCSESGDKTLWLAPSRSVYRTWLRTGRSIGPNEAFVSRRLGPGSGAGSALWPRIHEQNNSKFRTDKFDTWNKRKFWLMRLV